MHSISVKCPAKRCKGYAEASVTYDEGNTEATCDVCGKQVQFHYSVEVDGVSIPDEN